MTAITAHTTTTARHTAAPARDESLLARAWKAFVRARMRQAEREIMLHQHLLPQQLDSFGDRLTSRSEKDLPFVR